jgi:RsiW-degrading membrane proteinase PrsW (M82 family)
MEASEAEVGPRPGRWVRWRSHLHWPALRRLYRRQPSARQPPVSPPPAVAGWALSPRLPAFWLVVLLVLVGGWRMSLIFADAVRLYPTASVVAFVLFALYSIPFLLVLREVDYLEREPLVLRLVAVCWGGVVATSLANVGNDAAQGILAKLFSPGFADKWAAAIAGPANEETLKALGVVVIVLLARRHVNSTVDGFVYGALVGLGFQLVEDFVYAINAEVLAANGDQVAPVIAVFIVRGFLGGLWSHTLFTSLTGAGIGYAVVRTGRPWRVRLGVVVLAFLGACLLHFVWNSPLLADGFGVGVPGILAVLFIKGVPGLVAVLLILRAARRHEAAYYTELLTGVEPSVVAPGELAALVTRRARSAARHYAFTRSGMTAERSVRRLQAAQTRLAVEISRCGYSAYKEALRAARLMPFRPRDRSVSVMERTVREILQIRCRLRAVGLDAAVTHGREQRTVLGGWSIGLAALGLVVPGPSVLALVLAAVGSVKAKRARLTSDGRLGVGATFGGLGVVLWSLVVVVTRLNGG